MLTDQYPPNPNYEYVLDDIILVISRYLISNGYIFHHALDHSKSFTALINNDGITVNEAALPCFPLHNGKPLLYQGFKVVLCGDSQSFDLSETSLGQFIVKATANVEAYACVFPFHSGFNNNSQGGHWNIAVLFINGHTKQARLDNIEPLGENKTIENDPIVVNTGFYKSLQLILQGFTLNQVTAQTLQQTDVKLCGAIAAENALTYFNIGNTLAIKYANSKDIIELRKKHINLSNSEHFAIRQFNNWIFNGYKNDDYARADGEAIWHIFRKLQLENPEKYAADFAELVKTINENSETIEANLLKQLLVNFFKTYDNLLSPINIKGTPLVLKFFKKTDFEELANEYNVIEVIKILVQQFEVTPKRNLAILPADTTAVQQYKRNQGYSNTYRGDEYQKLVGMFFALKLYLKGIKQFKILTESADEAYDFGKFDDLIIETEEKFEVVQVKHAGSMDESNKVYTVDVLSATKDSKKSDIKKKAALHSYYDSWRKCKDKSKPIEFIFYTNHKLDNDLAKFYDAKSARYLHLLEPQSDAVLQTNQKKIINSIYQGSEFFANNVASNLLADLKFITTGLSDDVWKNFIDDNFQAIIGLLKKGGSFRKTKEYDAEKYQKIAFLLIGHFGLIEEAGNIQIKVPGDYFTAGRVYNPIHQYLHNKLAGSCLKQPILIIGKTLIFTKNLASCEMLVKILFPQKNQITTISFPTKTSAKVYINEAHAIACSSYLFGVAANEIPYSHNIYNLDEVLKIKLSATPNLPRYEFTDVASLDRSIQGFINAFNFNIEQPSIVELERQNFEHIKQHFQIEDHTYYLMFERYFLENFRAPSGVLITYNTLEEVFKKARLEIQRSRLVGFVERYTKEFKSNKPNVVSQRQLKAIDEVFLRNENIITIISGQPHIGKSFTMVAWIEKFQIEHSASLPKDGYAFLPVRDIWDTDIDLFIHQLRLLVIDNVEEIFENKARRQLLEEMINVAKQYRKKLILIVAEHKKMDLAMMVNGIPHTIIDCLPLTNDQIYAFVDIKPKDFLVVGNLYATVDNLLTQQNDSGLAMALRNPGYLQQIKNRQFFSDMMPNDPKADKHEIFIQQNIAVRGNVDFAKFVAKVSEPILIFHNHNQKAVSEYLDIKKFNHIDINVVAWPKEDQVKRIVVLAHGIASLSKEQANKLRERKNYIIVTSSITFFKCLAQFIAHQCYAPDEIGHSRLIATTNLLENDIWISKNIANDNFNYCQQREVFTKRALVSVDAGMGKSTMTNRLCRASNKRILSAERYHWRAPIYLDQLVAADEQKSFGQFIFEILQKMYELPSFFQVVIEHDLKHGNVLLVLDGGDQIKEEQLSDCKELYTKLISYEHIIFLTRPTQSRISFSANQEIVLQPFTDEQIKEYFHKAFSKPTINPFIDAANQFMQENIQLREMLGVPLQCYLFWQAWQPYYEQWRQNSAELILPKNVQGDTALIAIFQRYLEAKFYVHFKRNLKIVGSLLEQRERVNTLSIGYIDRFAHVSIWEHFADVRPYLHTALQQPVPQEWLDQDIAEIALIKRIAAPKQGAVAYVLAHRTYQEYAAAKYFVEGLMGLRQMHPKQKKWCKELLSIARFVHIYQQFWRFVLNWIQHHISLGNLPANTLSNFELYFKENGDLILARENDFWNCLIAKKSDFPLSYKPDSIPKPKQDPSIDEKNDNQAVGNVRIEPSKSFADFKEIEKIVSDYQGGTFMRHDSEVYRALEDIPNHTEVPITAKLALLQHAYAPNKKVHNSYRIHEATACSLRQLADYSRHTCELMFSYYSQQFHETAIFRYTKVHVLQAAKELLISRDNSSEFLQLLQYIQTSKSDFDILALEAINHIVSGIFSISLSHDIDELYKLFTGFVNMLKNMPSNNIELSKRYFVAVKVFIRVLNKFEKILTVSYITSVTSMSLSLMLIYAQYGESLIPNNAEAKVIEIITKHIRSISKDSINTIIMFMANEGYNTFPLLKMWLGIEFNDTFPYSNDCQLHLQRIESLQSEPNAFNTVVGTYAEIDGAIPSVCELQTGFNAFAAAYLIDLMNKTYWQYPVALVRNIPHLLKYHVDHGIYPHLALHVYLECLKKFVINDEYGNLFAAFFNNANLDAYAAMDYAWRVYTNTNSREAASVISTWCNHLQWPLFKASQATSLHLVTPGTGYVREFKAKDSLQLGGAVTFFKTLKKEPIQLEDTTIKLSALSLTKQQGQ
jgi:hypothetical protein